MTQNQINNLINFSLIFLHLNPFTQTKEYVMEKWYNIIDPTTNLDVNSDKNEETLNHKLIKEYHLNKALHLKYKTTSVLSLIIDIADSVNNNDSRMYLEDWIDIFRFYVDVERINKLNTDVLVHDRLIMYRDKILSDTLNSRTYNLEILID